MAPAQPSDQHWSLDDLFEHRPKLRALFEMLREDIESLGEIEMVVTRTQVSFGAKRKFAWLWPSPTRRINPEGTLMMTLDLTEPRQHPLLSSVEQTFPGKWTHQIAVTDHSVVEQIREQGWIPSAHAFGTMERASTRRN